MYFHNPLETFNCLHHPQTPDASPWSSKNTYPSPLDAGETTVDPYKALNDLKDWLVANKADLPEYDHAMSFIG